MRRREFITVLGGAAAAHGRLRRSAAATPFDAADRRADGILPRPSGRRSLVRGIPATLEQSGWSDGQHNSSLDGSGANLDQITAYGRNCRPAPDVIVVMGNYVARIIAATKTIPIVFTGRLRSE